MVALSAVFANDQIQGNISKAGVVFNNISLANVTGISAIATTSQGQTTICAFSYLP